MLNKIFARYNKIKYKIINFCKTKYKDILICISFHIFNHNYVLKECKRLLKTKNPKYYYYIGRVYSYNYNMKHAICYLEEYLKLSLINKSINDNCSICLDPINSLDCTKLKCNHYYHAYCLKILLETHKLCPLCRSNIIECNGQYNKYQLEVIKILARNYYINQDYDKTIQYCNLSIKHDKYDNKIYELIINSYINQNKLSESINITKLYISNQIQYIRIPITLTNKLLTSIGIMYIICNITRYIIK